MSRKKIYIASPYTIGDPEENVRRQIDAANELINAGYAPFAPLLSHYQHIIHPQPHDVWMDIDLIWLAECDAVLRLLGESKGADIEVQFAIEHGIPVHYTVQQIKHWIPS